MKVLFIDDKDHVGDEIPGRIEAVFTFDEDEGVELHAVLTHEGIILDVVDAHGEVIRTAGLDVDGLFELTH